MNLQPKIENKKKESRGYAVTDRNTGGSDHLHEREDPHARLRADGADQRDRDRALAALESGSRRSPGDEVGAPDALPESMAAARADLRPHGAARAGADDGQERAHRASRSAGSHLAAGSVDRGRDRGHRRPADRK